MITKFIQNLTGTLRQILPPSRSPSRSPREFVRQTEFPF